MSTDDDTKYAEVPPDFPFLMYVGRYDRLRSHANGRRR